MGDDRNSWGFDAAQRKAWHNEEERAFGRGAGDKWEVGAQDAGRRGGRTSSLFALLLLLLCCGPPD